MTKEIKIGLTVFVALLLSYLSLTWASRSHLFAGEGVKYSIDFQHISGLLVGDPVHIRGFTMGRVESIEPQMDKVVVQISLDRDYPIPEGTTAEIQPKELMGGKQVELIQGLGTAALTPGETLVGESSLDFSSAFSQMGGLFEQVEGDRMSQFFDRMDSLLYSVYRISTAVDEKGISNIIFLLESNLRGIQGLLQEWESRNMLGQIDSTMNILQQSLRNADMRISQAGHLLHKTDSLYLPKISINLDSLQVLIQNLNQLSRRGEQLLDQPDSFVDKVTTDRAFAARMDSAISRLNRVLLQIESEKIIVGFKRRKQKQD